MTFVVTIAVKLRVWDGGDQKHIQHGTVTFEEASGFVVDDEISLDDVVDAARQLTLAATDGIEGHLSVTHSGVNVPHAARFLEIMLELVGESNDAAWRDLLTKLSADLQRHVWGQE